MYRILLVDDEPNVLNALRRELQSDYEIEAFSNPREALLRCKQASFDLVIVDYQMPEINGIMFLKEFKTIQPDAVRLVLSGQADFNAVVGALNETHIYRFMEKPWDKTELATTLAEALRQREQVLKNRRLLEVCRQQRNWQPAHDPNRIYQVLVVDDEPNILSVVARDMNVRGGYYDLQLAMLNQADPSAHSEKRDLQFKVSSTTSPLDALERAKQTNYDVVISDYLMPEMDGLHFLEAFREIQPDTARILFSGKADKDTVVKAINSSEIYGLISKPWHEYTLKNVLSQAISYHDLLRENHLLSEQVGDAGIH